MQNTQLKDYVKLFKGVFEPELCDRTVELLSKVEFIGHKFYDDSTKEYFSNEKELSSYYGKVETNDIIMERTWQIIKVYNGGLNMPWWNGWTGFSEPKYNKYVPGTQMKEHCDHIKDLFPGDRKGVPIVTVLTGLNDDYEGGELIMFGDTEYKLGKGDTIVFPSNFLYPHRINEVTKGARYSFVSWVW